jgi:SAM-dependent methyltransferase
VPAAGDGGAGWRRAALTLRDATRRLRMGSARREVSERVWRSRGGDEWVAGYWDDDASARRDHLVDALRTTFGAPTSVLDVGCNAGPSLRRIAREFPGCALRGFDINADAVTGARQGLAALGVAADLSVGSYYDVLPAIETASADVVTSSFALAYVPPAHLAGVLAEMVRIAVRGLVLVEPHAFGADRPAGQLTKPWYDWRHDYSAALSGLGILAARLVLSDLPDPGGADSGLLVVDLR